MFVSFSLQFLAFDTEASHDILKVWDGSPENEMSLKEVSGSLLPEGIHSTLNIVTIQFETDFYITKSGFAIDFSSEYTPQLLRLSVLNIFRKKSLNEAYSVWQLMHIPRKKLNILLLILSEICYCVLKSCESLSRLYVSVLVQSRLYPLLWNFIFCSCNL